MKFLYDLFFLPFEKMFTTDFADLLLGFKCSTGEYDDMAVGYITPALVIIVSSIIAVCLYYFVINHPRFNKVWHWLLFMVLPFTATLLLNRYFGLSFYLSLDSIDIECMEEFADSVFWMFGLASAFMSCVCYIFFSFLINLFRLSRNCKCTPFNITLIKK